MATLRPSDLELTPARGGGAVRLWRAPGMGAARTSPCSPPTPPASSCVSSIATARPKNAASSCRSSPTRSGTAICATSARARCYGYRVHGPLRTGRRPPLQSRTSCCSIPARARTPAQLKWDHACFGYTIGAKDEDLSFDERDSAPFMPKNVVIDPNFDWKRKAASTSFPGNTPSSTRRTCAASRRHHPAVPEASARHVTRASRYQGSAPVREITRHHGGRAAADPHFLDDAHLLERGLSNYWGYNTIGVLRAGSALRGGSRQQPARVQGDGRAFARRRARGHPRRRLQPHRRGQRTRPDAVVSRHRQRLVLPAAAGSASATTSTTPARETR